jgi:hypothetical protein
VSFAAITLCVASQRVFIVVSVYFVIDSVRKLLDTLSYIYLIWGYTAYTFNGIISILSKCVRNLILKISVPLDSNQISSSLSETQFAFQ